MILVPFESWAQTLRFVFGMSQPEMPENLENHVLKFSPLLFQILPRSLKVNVREGLYPKDLSFVWFSWAARFVWVKCKKLNPPIVLRRLKVWFFSSMCTKNLSLIRINWAERFIWPLERFWPPLANGKLHPSQWRVGGKFCVNRSERSPGPTKSCGAMKLYRKMRESMGFNLTEAVYKNTSYLHEASILVEKKLQIFNQNDHVVQ